MDVFADRLPTLATSRLRLRHPRPTDADDILTIFGDAEVMRYWSHGPLEDRQAALDYLAGIDTGFAARALFQWAVTRPEEDRLIGTVTLFQWSRQNRRAEIGFILGRAHWGHGYAAEAARAVLRFGFERMDLHRVEADVDPANAGSVRLLERLGFRREGYLRERWFTYGRWSDSALYGLLRSAFDGLEDGDG